jgi:hypothetical protein
MMFSGEEGWMVLLIIILTPLFIIYAVLVILSSLSRGVTSTLAASRKVGKNKPWNIKIF